MHCANSVALFDRWRAITDREAVQIIASGFATQ
jgi:hypothetical protein